MGVALRVLRERADAEEVLQETFLEVWRRAREYSPARGTVEAWLLTIVRTRAIDRLRSRAARGRMAEAKAAEAVPFSRYVVSPTSTSGLVSSTASGDAYFVEAGRQTGYGARESHHYR